VALALVEATVVANRRRAVVAPMLAACVAAVATLGSGCKHEATIVAPPPPEVSISQPIQEPVRDTVEFTGRVSAIDSVDVRARVSGYITKVNFTAGALVNVGDVLFEIDPREYQAAVLKAEGEVARLRAMVARADSEVARNAARRPTGPATARD
jgi:multidrug efflux system membrane fusion protein